MIKETYMTRKTFRRSVMAGMAVVALTLSACSRSSNEAEPTPDPTTVADGSAPPVTVVIDPEIREKLNVDSGEAVIPGSIESVTVETLDAECTVAVGGLRALMEQYPSLRQVPPDGTYDAAFAEAKGVCEGNDPQQWADFYTKELAGWIYAAVDVSGNITVTTEPAAPAADGDTGSDNDTDDESDQDGNQD
jgi:hypothetical protein